MGNNQATASWSVDDWAYGTGTNAVPVDEVVEEVGKMPARYFGGKRIGNDPSMNQMQQDLLSFDDTLKNLFRRRKHKRAAQQPQGEGQDQYEDGQAYAEEAEEPTYLDPTPRDKESSDQSASALPNASGAAATNKSKLLWRCSSCAAENKVTESSCRRCGQAETKF